MPFFFGIFYYASGRNGTEWQILLSLFLGLFQCILAWKEAIRGFFNFLNFFSIFLEFYITRRIRTKRKDKFFFLLFLSLFQPILAWNESIRVFITFTNFVAIFLEFSIIGRVGTDRNNNFHFLPFWPFTYVLWIEKNP